MVVRSPRPGNHDGRPGHNHRRGSYDHRRRWQNRYRHGQSEPNGDMHPGVSRLRQGETCHAEEGSDTHYAQHVYRFHGVILLLFPVSKTIHTGSDISCHERKRVGAQAVHQAPSYIDSPMSEPNVTVVCPRSLTAVKTPEEDRKPLALCTLLVYSSRYEFADNQGSCLPLSWQCDVPDTHLSLCQARRHRAMPEE
jgi:hypothetical protein